jgi:hypothetical protein
MTARRRTATVLWGLGEYSGAGPSIVARWRFLDAIAAHVPEALRDLEGVGSQQPRWKALQAWGARWRLRDSWLLTVADQTLDRWSRHPSTRYQWAKPGIAHAIPQWPARPHGWDPTVETEAGYRRRVDEYVRSAIAVAREAGFTPTARRRVRRNAGSDYFLRALARWHVGKTSITDLQMELGDREDDSTLRKGMQDAATLIGLTWKPQRGRPRKTGKTESR